MDKKDFNKKIAETQDFLDLLGESEPIERTIARAFCLLPIFQSKITHEDGLMIAKLKCKYGNELSRDDIIFLCLEATFHPENMSVYINYIKHRYYDEKLCEFLRKSDSPRFSPDT